MQKPLSESLQKLRRAQRALTRRKRRSKVRVSFRHSTGSRTSGAAKRASRQLKAGDIKPGGGTPSSRPLPPAPSSSEDVGGCFGSPPKPPRPPPKDNVREIIKHGGEKNAGEGRHRAMPPETPAQPKAPDTGNQTLSPQIEHIEAIEDTKGKAQAGKTVESSIERRPVQPASGQPRYSVFPKKTHHRRKPSVNDKLATLVKPEHSESIRRSLIQQQRLSALALSNTQPAPTTALPQKELLDLSETPLTTTKAETGTTNEPKMEARSSERTLEKFARELEEFARSTQAFERISASLSTPTTTQTHASVRTVQEFLPYRQQFQEAGLAVTSMEQKAPLKVLRRHPPQSRLGDSPLNHFGSKVPAQGISFSGTKESSSGTVIHKPRRDPMTLSVADEAPEIQEGKTTEKTPAEAVSSLNQEIYSASPSTFIKPVKLAAVQKKVIRLRPSTVFLANKPLPIAPRSPQPPSSKDTRETVAGSQSTTKPEGYQKLASSTGTEKEPLLPLSEQQQQNSMGTWSSGSKSLKGKEVDRGLVKDERSLLALPPSRTSSQTRHRIALPSKTSWGPTITTAATIRQLPTIIVKEKEYPSEKREQKILGDLDTPSFFKKGIDDVVRKLDAMEVNKRTPLASSLSSPTENKKRPSSSGNNKTPSQTQRLQKAADMRRERLDAENERSAPKPLQPQPQQQTQFIHGMVPPPLPMPPPGELGLRPRDQALSSRQNMVPRRGGSRIVQEQFGAGGMGPGMGMMPMVEDDRDISDRDVLKGLKIICAASADAEFDGLIRRETGLRLRRFLADLKTFEFLGGHQGPGRENGQGGQRVSRQRGPPELGMGMGVGGGQQQQMGQIVRRRIDMQVERESRRRSIGGTDGVSDLREVGEGKNMRESKRSTVETRASIREENRRRSFNGGVGMGVALMR
ncbi:hypothetical protein QBC36DRAFT_10576 [Triangularia setosa]|uniref:Uncharacterized protein n=1 Tax=Triangularia setosa TaxID=2587417 RepID=A0AAN6WII9_9PEZI|nr:hypothetical protein QBC36DRAFT_10576 [Podospora setosa]